MDSSYDIWFLVPPLGRLQCFLYEIKVVPGLHGLKIGVSVNMSHNSTQAICRNSPESLQSQNKGVK